jgi:pimeloyl-ACP methyl ester carboxylesterase
MMGDPATRYAKSGTASIAYRLFGQGPSDLVIVPGSISHVEYAWEDPGLARFLRRLGRFCRVIAFDRRGMGLSDPIPPGETPTLEQRIDDLDAVMRAAGSERAALFAWSEGGPTSLLFAAGHPERTTALVLHGTAARFSSAPDYPQGVAQEILDLFIEALEEEWGTGVAFELYSPSLVGDVRAKEWWAGYQRNSTSPGSLVASLRMHLEIDVRHVLDRIQAPTLIIHSVDDAIVPVEAARYLAASIGGARYVELPRADHTYWTADAATILDEIEELLTGARPPADPDRVLATVLFTDIVSSTERAAALGDRRWRELLEAHHMTVRRQLSRHRGKELDTAGDGFLAAFDGPARAIRCAWDIRDALGTLGIHIRAGLHTGEVELRGEGFAGIAVHIGARVAAAAQSDEILISSTVKDLVAGSGISLVPKGTQILRGVPDEWSLFAVQGV